VPLSALGSRGGDDDRRGPAELSGIPEGSAVATGNVNAHVTSPAAPGDRNGQWLASWGTRHATYDTETG